MNYGGKRPGAGRKPNPVKRRRLWASVLPETFEVITKIAFLRCDSIGMVLDAKFKPRKPKVSGI